MSEEMKQEVWRGKGAIKSVYLLTGAHVEAYDKEGLPLIQYRGKFHLVKDRVLNNAPSDAEYYIWERANFTKITREQFADYIEE